jgi:hypothetical protein
MLRNFSIVVGLFLCSLPAFSQGTTLGSIVGTVLDPSGAAVPGASVTVLNTQTGVPRKLTSNNEG